MIYDIPHTDHFFWPSPTSAFSGKPFTCPRRKDESGGIVFLDLDWLEYIRFMNTPRRSNGCRRQRLIIWGINDKKHLDNKKTNPACRLSPSEATADAHRYPKRFGQVWGLPAIDYSITPQTFPSTGIASGASPSPQRNQRAARHAAGIAFCPSSILRSFAEQNPAEGVTYVKVI